LENQQLTLNDYGNKKAFENHKQKQLSNQTLPPTDNNSQLLTNEMAKQNESYDE